MWPQLATGEAIPPPPPPMAGHWRSHPHPPPPMAGHWRSHPPPPSPHGRPLEKPPPPPPLMAGHWRSPIRSTMYHNGFTRTCKHTQTSVDTPSTVRQYILGCISQNFAYIPYNWHLVKTFCLVHNYIISRDFPCVHSVMCCV